MCAVSSRRRLLSWLALPLLLLAATLSANAQDLPSSGTQSPPIDSQTLDVSSMTQSELWALYFVTLAEQERLLQADRLNSRLYNDYMMRLFDDLSMQALASKHTARRANLALIAANQDLSSSEQSAQSLKDAADKAIKTAKAYQLAAILLAVGLAASLIF